MLKLTLVKRIFVYKLEIKHQSGSRATTVFLFVHGETVVAAAPDANPQRKVAPLFLETACRLRLQRAVGASRDTAMFPERRSWIKNSRLKA